MNTIDEASEWQENASRSTFRNDSGFQIDKSLMKNIYIGDKEFTFDPRERIFEASRPVEEDK